MDYLVDGFVCSLSGMGEKRNKLSQFWIECIKQEMGRYTY